MWDLPGPGIEPVSPALAGGFLNTAPPGKSEAVVLKCDTKTATETLSVGLEGQNYVYTLRCHLPFSLCWLCTDVNKSDRGLIG